MIAAFRKSCFTHHRVTQIGGASNLGWATNADEESFASIAAYGLTSAKYARGEFEIGRESSAVGARTEFFASKNLSYMPIAGFQGTLPTTGQAKSVKGWAEAGFPHGMKYIEFGNETSYGYQYGETGEWYNSTAYKKRAKEYAERGKEAAEALVGTGVKLLIQGDDGGSGSPNWVNEVLLAWPKCWEHAAFGGWTIHCYPRQTKFGLTDTYGIPKMERLTKLLEEKGDASSSIMNTEWGIPTTANGRKLSSGQNMNYEEGAKVLEEHHPKLLTASKNRLQMLLLYQNHNQQVDNGTSTEQEWFFGALTSAGERKGVFTTFVEKWLKGEA